jgi:hypothetical protein
MDTERVTFKSTGTTGTVIATAERAGLGDLNGRWYQVRWDDGETMWVFSGSVQTDSQAAAERASNEREQVEQVFGLTGGELMDVAWVPNYRTDGSALVGTAQWSPFTFTYWYQGVPDYVGESLQFPISQTYRTVCEQELYGKVPETVTDDEGTWKVVARYSTSGECECPSKNGSIPGIADERGLNIMETPCSLCGENPQSFHGYIYIGDGWAEIVYRLEPKPRTFVATFTLTTDADVSWGMVLAVNATG